MSKLTTFIVRMTGSGAYSIDRYYNGEFQEVISSNNGYKQSNENELNNFGKIIINNYQEELTGNKFIEELDKMYKEKYGEDEEDSFDGFGDDDFLSDIGEILSEGFDETNSKEVIICLLKGYKREFEGGGGLEITNVYKIKDGFYKEEMTIQEIDDLIFGCQLVETDKRIKIKYSKDGEITSIDGREEHDFHTIKIKQ